MFIGASAFGYDGKPRGALAFLERLDGVISPLGLGGFINSIVQPKIQSSARERFASEGQDVGGWEPLKESTLRFREAQGFPPGPINERTGRLREYIVENQGTVAYDGLGTFFSWPTPPPIAGSDLAYSYATAQSGSSRWRTPARPVAAISFEDMVAINLGLGKWLDGIA